MGLRSRLKGRVRRLFSSPSTAPAATPPSAPEPPSQTAAPTPQSPSHNPTSVPPPRAPAQATAVPASPGEDDKVARHFERTRRAVLRFIDEAGGTAGLADMHAYSEQRYFVGHKRFSDLMETLVDEQLIQFDHARGEALLTEAGRTLAHTPLPKRVRTAP